MSRHPLRGYLDQLKSRATGSSPTENFYSYAEVPDWAIRQAIEVHDDLLEALTEFRAFIRDGWDGAVRLQSSSLVADIYADKLFRKVDAAIARTEATDTETER